MRTLLMGTFAVLALWGAAVAIYLAGWNGDDPSWRALGLFVLGSIAVLQLQLNWFESFRTRLQAEETRQLLARSRHREEPPQ